MDHGNAPVKVACFARVLHYRRGSYKLAT